MTQMDSLELNLYRLITSLHKEIVALHPTDGFSSPRDIKLVKIVNKKGTILNHLQEAMRVINPDYKP